MDYDKLIEDLREIAEKNSISTYKRTKCAQATTAIESLRTDLARVTAERDAAVRDIWVAKWISCKHGADCDFIRARTGCPDCAGCGDWEWRGIQKESQP